jgi:hypothetical protein
VQGVFSVPALSAVVEVGVQPSAHQLDQLYGAVVEVQSAVAQVGQQQGAQLPGAECVVGDERCERGRGRVRRVVGGVDGLAHRRVRRASR